MTNEEMIEEFEDLVPDYNSQAEGCGIEDRGITDRYDACAYGFEQGVIRTKELLIEHLKQALQLKDQQAQEAIRKVVENYKWENDCGCENCDAIKKVLCAIINQIKSNQMTETS